MRRFCSTLNDTNVITKLTKFHKVNGKPLRIAVIGLSNKRARDSFQVSMLLQRVGYKIIPVNPMLINKKIMTVLNEQVHADLSTITGPVDIVNVFRASEACEEIAEEVINNLPTLGKPVFWLQQGITNDKAIELCEKAGLDCVQDRCLKIEVCNRRPSFYPGGVSKL